MFSSGYAYQRICLPVLLAASFQPVVAQAASFDCNGRKTVLEIFICHDAELSFLDEQVAQAYFETRAGFPTGSSGHKDVLDSQRQFLKQRTQVCTIPPQDNFSDEDTDKIVTCLKGIYTLRLNALEKHAPIIAKASSLNITQTKIPSILANTTVTEDLIADAERGEKEAQRQLGNYYETRDDAEAVKWWRKSADQSDAKAQFKLGNAYRDGTGVSKNEAEAIKWWKLAADQGNAEAQNILQKIETKITAQQQAKAEEEAVAQIDNEKTAQQQAKTEGDAWVVCRGSAEKMADVIAKYDYSSDWTPNYRAVTEGDYITIYGRDIKFLNKYGTSRYNPYTCTYNIKTKTGSALFNSFNYDE